MIPVDAGTRPTRRSFLAGAAALAGALATSLPSAAAVSVGPRKLRELERRLPGRIVLPDDPNFARLARPQNLAYADRLPAAIARCRNAGDVAAAIDWCREFDVPLAPRGGGHSYAGYSTTRGLLIDLAGMNAASFDRKTGVLRLSGGSVNAQLYAALEAEGVAITHGRCLTVGAAGFLLGGGIGFNMRGHGVGSDQLLATELVTADGRLRRADAGRHPDLFWACRGGAGRNFGISTAFSLQTYPVGDLVVFDLVFEKRPLALLDALLPALDSGPEGLGVTVSIEAVTPAERASGEDVTIFVFGQFAGRRRALADILAPAYAIARPSYEKIETMSYWEAQRYLAEAGAANAYHDNSRFWQRTPEKPDLEALLDRLRAFPGTSRYAYLSLFLTGGVMNAPSPDATAFVHRDSRWLVATSISWGKEDDEPTIRHAKSWQRQLYELVAGLGEGAFQNFPDRWLDDWARQYYGVNLPRLRKIKADVDPGQLFRFGQSIPPA